MHYGDGMMKEEIERAMKRAEAASTRGSSGSRFGYYRSPLGKGFNFDTNRPMNEQRNPYSRKGARQHDDIDTEGGFRVIYEESYVNMNAGGFDLNGAASKSSSHRSTNIIIRSGKEYVVERMKERRETRLRERGDPNPYKTQRRHAGSSGGGGEGEGVKGGNAQQQQQQQQQQSSSGCVIM
jgi:hypothetical protein